MAEHEAATALASKPPKSPPLAFITSSNDALCPPAGAPVNLPHHFNYNYSPEATMSPSDRHKMSSGPHVPDYMVRELHAHVQKQSEALRLQQIGFAAERECWDMERERLYRRVASLEALLKSANGHSPARSPIVSPGNTYTPPLPKSSNASSRLASIVEASSEQSIVPNDKRLSFLKRDAPPSRLEIPLKAPTIAYADGQLDEISVQMEQPPSPPVTRKSMSPPPPANRHLAGHTPLKIPDRPAELSSPPRSRRATNLDESPTRSNTEHNLLMCQNDGLSDEDRPLKGPLHMPELPNTPGEENFTMMMLSARLKEIEEHPEDHQPMVLREQSVHPLLPIPEDDSETGAAQKITSAIASATQALSDGKVLSPSGRSPPPILELEPGGIKLKKKASSNFGAPFGQLGDNYRRF